MSSALIGGLVASVLLLSSVAAPLGEYIAYAESESQETASQGTPLPHKPSEPDQPEKNPEAEKADAGKASGGQSDGSGSAEPTAMPDVQESAKPDPTKAPEAQASAEPSAGPTPEVDETPAPTQRPQGGLTLLPASNRKADLRLGTFKYLKGGMRIPVLYQYQYKTAVAKMGDRTISVATSGCGATAVSMVVAYLTENKKQTPYTLFRWAAEKGLYSGDGLGHSALSRLASKYGVESRWTADEQSVLDALNSGYPVIAHMGEGAFTDDGHYIVLRGVAKNGKVYVNDPNSASNSKKTFSMSKIVRESKTDRPFMICTSEEITEPTATPKIAEAMADRSVVGKEATRVSMPETIGKFLVTTPPENTATPAPETTVAPEKTATPAPEKTDAPVVTVLPVPEIIIAPDATATPAPEVIATPEATATPVPETTAAPEVTAAPEATATPEATMSPVPETTVAPEATATPAPETTDAPVVTVSPVPETTIAPVATETPLPETTVAPKVTSTPVPETTVAPEVTATPAPEPTIAPEATATPAPETTIAPEVTATRAPETIIESDATAMPALEETIAPETTIGPEETLALEATETPMPENADAVTPFSYEDGVILLTAASELPIPDGVQLVVQKLDSSAQPGLDGLQGKRALESYRVSFQLDGAEVMGGTALELRLAIKDLGLTEASTYLLDGSEVLWQKAAPGQTETIVFSMPSGGTFTFAQDAPLNASLQYEDDLLRAEVTVADAARIPAGAVLTLGTTPSEYETYAETLAANGIGANRILGIYGMTLRLAGPEGPLDLGGTPLSVRLTYKGLSLDGAQAWMLNQGGAVQAEVTDGGAGLTVAFELNGEASFAVVFARPVNTETVYTFEDDTVLVVATLSDPSAMPYGASLQVSAVDAQPYAPYCEAIESEKGEGEESANAPRAVRKAMSPADEDTSQDDEAGLFYYDRRAYDIRFVLDGLEYEPSIGTVGVSIHFKEDAADAPAGENLTEISVVHIQESNGEVTPVALDADYDTTNAGSLASVSFETDSFSVYLITNGYTKSSALTYNIVDTAAETFTNTPYYYANRKLGIAGSFHLVAFNSLTLSAHTNGNVLAKSLTANVNFGTNGLANELSYVQTYAKVNGVSASSDTHVLALGSGVKVSLADNGNAFAINGTKLDRPKNVWQDNDTAALPFINLASVKSECQSISSTISGYANANVTASLSDMNNRSLTLTAPTGVGVYNFTAAQVNGYASTDLKLTGFTSGNSGSMIINVNCSGVTSLTLPNVRMFVNGIEATTSEVTDFANGRVLWNFYNISGLTINAKLMKGSILAPGATVNLNQNLNGTVVADTITVYAESHREDFVGKISDTVTVRKVWKDALGNTLTGTGIDQSSVTVQLYKKSSGGIVTAHGSAVVLNSANSWKHAWSGLDSGYTYYAQETYVGAEAVVTDPNFATQQAAGTIVTYANNAGITIG